MRLTGLLFLATLTSSVFAQVNSPRLWLRSDAGLPASGGVLQWSDQSGNAFHATQSIGAAAPEVFANTLNGQPALRFSRPGVLTLDWLQIQGNVITAPYYGVVFVASDDWGTDTYRTIFSNWGNTTQSQSVFAGLVGIDTDGANTARMRFTDHVGGAFEGQQGAGIVTSRTGWHIYTCVHDASGVRIYQNRRLIHSRSTGIPPRNGAGPYTIARQGTLTEYWRGWIAEVIVFNRALSDADLEATWDYLADKFALARPPGFLRQPISRVACRNSSVTLSADISAFGTVNAAWLRNGSTYTVTPNTQGGTISLVIPSLSDSDVGTWQVLLTGPNGSAVSSTFTVSIAPPSSPGCIACDSIDFNLNGVFPEDEDVIDFFNVLAGGTCPYPPPIGQVCDIDFNNNTVFPEDADVIDFFTVLAGGECP
jgi:hypothetical protein